MRADEREVDSDTDSDTVAGEFTELHGGSGMSLQQGATVLKEGVGKVLVWG